MSVVGAFQPNALQLAKLRLSRPESPRCGFIALFLKKIPKTPGQS